MFTLLFVLGCDAGSREWAGAAERLLDDTDVADPGSDTAVETGHDTDTDTDSDTDTTGTDTGLEQLEGDPCNRPIPDDALVIRDETSSDQGGMSAWVCRAGMFSTGGFAVSTYVESRGDALLSGTGGRAWVKASGRLVVYAGPNEVWIEEGAEITVEADGVVVNTCATIAFTGGPAGGC